MKLQAKNPAGRPTNTLANSSFLSIRIGNAYDELGRVTKDERTTGNRKVFYDVFCNECKRTSKTTKMALMQGRKCPYCRAPWATTGHIRTFFLGLQEALLIDGPPWAAVKKLPDGFKTAWVATGKRFYTVDDTGRGTIPLTTIEESTVLQESAVREQALETQEFPENPPRVTVTPELDQAAYQGLYGTTQTPPNPAFNDPETKPWVLVTKTLYDAFKAAKTPEDWADLESENGVTIPKNSRTSIAANYPETWLYIYYPPTLALSDDYEDLI